MPNFQFLTRIIKAQSQSRRRRPLLMEAQIPYRKSSKSGINGHLSNNEEGSVAMRIFRLIIATVVALPLLIGTALADTYVRGYTKKDGTYVAPHYRSSPDRSYNNNWSVSPNVNPHTGRQGTRSPTFDDRPPRSPSFGNPYRDSGSNSERRRY